MSVLCSRVCVVLLALGFAGTAQAQSLNTRDDAPPSAEAKMQRHLTGARHAGKAAGGSLVPQKRHVECGGQIGGGQSSEAQRRGQLAAGAHSLGLIRDQGSIDGQDVAVTGDIVILCK